jgi:GntR family transcriptional regulator
MSRPVKKKGASLPAYRQIADKLIRNIESGKLRPGDPVPSEREIATEYAVSLMTARHALQQLSLEGLVNRRPRVGTFVALPKIHFNKLTSFTEEMVTRGYAPKSRILNAADGIHNDEVSSRLSLPLGSPLIRLQRLRLSGDEPFALETCYMSSDRFEGILRENLAVKSLFTTLIDGYGLKIAYADEEIDCTVADPKTAHLLNVPAGAAILRIRQLLYGGTEPVVYSSALYRSDRHSLVIRRFR